MGGGCRGDGGLELAADTGGVGELYDGLLIRSLFSSFVAVTISRLYDYDFTTTLYSGVRRSFWRRRSLGRAEGRAGEVYTYIHTSTYLILSLLSLCLVGFGSDIWVWFDWVGRGYISYLWACFYNGGSGGRRQAGGVGGWGVPIGWVNKNFDLSSREAPTVDSGLLSLSNCLPRIIPCGTSGRPVANSYVGRLVDINGMVRGFAGEYSHYVYFNFWIHGHVAPVPCP